MTEGFVDVHCHLLPGVDDGSQSIEESVELLQAAYNDGIRTIVVTPHVRRPWLTKYPREKITEAYALLKEEAHKIAPNLDIVIGSEVYSSHEILEEHQSRIISFNKTTYILTEFSPETRYEDILWGLDKVRQIGGDPIIAHMERYECLRKDIKKVEHLYEMGNILQVNASSITHPRDWAHKRFIKKCLKEELIHLVGTDAHDMKRRPPKMRDSYNYVCKKYSEEYADEIFCQNALDLLNQNI